MSADTSSLRRNNRARSLIGILLLAAALTLPACARPPAPGLDGALPIVWPEPPLPPKIVYTGQIRDARDLGIGQGLWRRFLVALGGAEPRPLVRPYGLYVDGAGRLMVADTGGGAVHLFDRQADRHQLIGAGETPTLLTPIALTADSQQRLYITDAAQGILFRYDLATQTLVAWITGLQRPTGLAYSAATELLYVTETTAHQIVAFDLQGQEHFRIGSRGTAPGEFNYPTDLAIAPDGRLVVNDALNARIQIFSSTGEVLGAFGQAGQRPGRLNKPKGVATDSAGHIYVCDALLDAVQVFDPQGRLLLSFGAPGDEPGQFWMPSGIYIDPNDTIYVTDTYNRRIQRFQYLGSPYEHDSLQPF